jgi:hypothetical protein
MALTQQWQAPMKPTAAKLNTASIPVVSSPSDISGGVGPFKGQIVFCTADNMLYRYDGDAIGWIAFAATGGNTSATRHEARYEHRVAQTIPNAFDTKIDFDTAAVTCDDVTYIGSTSRIFLLNRAGVWLITASMRWLAGTTGERHMFLSIGNDQTILAKRFAWVSSNNVGSVPISLSVATMVKINSYDPILGKVIHLGCWQNNGSSLNTDVGFGGSNHISLTWLRPI